LSHVAFVVSWFLWTTVIITSNAHCGIYACNRPERGIYVPSLSPYEKTLLRAAHLSVTISQTTNSYLPPVSPSTELIPVP
ncbi:hypothetical protein BGX38DRAFT_1184601, partial [Terfezia claveryi]